MIFLNLYDDWLFFVHHIQRERRILIANNSNNLIVKGNISIKTGIVLV